MVVFVVVHEWNVGEICHATVAGVYEKESDALERMRETAERFADGDRLADGGRNIIIEHTGGHDRDEIFISERVVE